MILDLNSNQIIISSNDLSTYNLKYLNNFFNKEVYKNKNILYFEEEFKDVKFELYDNNFIKFNLYTNTLNNNVKQIEVEEVINIDKLQSLEDIDIIEDIDKLQSLEDIDKSKDNLKNIEEEFNFSVKTTYYFDIKVTYKYNEVTYYIGLKNMNLEDKIHVFNLINSNILYHYTNVYEYKGKVQYLNLHYNYSEVVKYLDKANYKFNEFKLLIFIDKNKEEVQRIFEFIKYSILQLYKLGYHYKELNKLFIILSKYIYKGKIYYLFLFLHEFAKFKKIAYYNNDYSSKLKRLVLKDKRFNIDLNNYDEELSYLNLCFFERSYKERFAIGDVEEYEEDLKERRCENTYLKGYKLNSHGFDKILGDVRSTELHYNDEFYKAHQYKNENRRTH